MDDNFRERNEVNRRKQRLGEMCKTGGGAFPRGEIIVFEGVQSSNNQLVGLLQTTVCRMFEY